MARHTLLFVTLLALASSAQASPEAREWRFRVFLDDAEIGYHDGEWLALESAARGNRKLRYRLE